MYAQPPGSMLSATPGGCRKHHTSRAPTTAKTGRIPFNVNSRTRAARGTGSDLIVRSLSNTYDFTCFSPRNHGTFLLRLLLLYRLWKFVKVRKVTLAAFLFYTAPKGGQDVPQHQIA